LKLYSSPYDYDPDNDDVALLKTYVSIPLAFRIINLSNGNYVGDRNIWVTDSRVSGENNSGFNVSNGVRVHFSSTSAKFILNPSANEGGYTQVAGILDQNLDGFYDTWSEDKEIIYGDYSGTPRYSEPLEASSDLDDFYNTGLENSYNFLAKHKEGNKVVSNWDEITLNKQEYYSIDDIVPGVDEQGKFKNGKPVCNTGTQKIAYCDMTVWAEGWDLSIVDAISKLSFNLAITFEIDKA